MADTVRSWILAWYGIAFAGCLGLLLNLPYVQGQTASGVVHPGGACRPYGALCSGNHLPSFMFTDNSNGKLVVIDSASRPWLNYYPKTGRVSWNGPSGDGNKSDHWETVIPESLRPSFERFIWSK